MKYYPNYNLIRQTVGRGYYSHDALKQAYNILYNKYVNLFKRRVTIIEIEANSTFSSYIYTPNAVYGVYKTLVYNEYTVDGAGTGVDLTTDINNGIVEVLGNNDIWGPLTDTANSATATNTALNRSGVWFNSVGAAGPFTFTITVNSECDKDLYVGVGTDNRYNFTLNGVTVVNNFPFNSMPYYISPLFTWQYANDRFHEFQHWNIYPLHLNKGINVLTLSGINPDAPSPGYMGLEIYDDSLQAIRDAKLDPNFLADPVNFAFDKNYYTNLNMIFSTRYIKSNNNILINEPFTIDIQDPYTCPASSSNRVVVEAQTIANKSTIISQSLKVELEKILNFLFNKIENCCP